MKLHLLTFVMIFGLITGCNTGTNMKTTEKEELSKDDFKYLLEQFADLKIMRYEVPGFDDLSLQQKKLVYYLSEAALCGRDIIFDQNYKYNLKIRKTLEQVYLNYQGDRETENFNNFVVYLKRVWFSNGIHHHYSTDKFSPEFMPEYFAELIMNSEGAEFPIDNGETVEELALQLTSIIFDPDIAPKRISLDPEKDMIKASACNFYEGVTEQEAADFYNKLKDPSDETPISYGLNSKLVKENGEVREDIYKIGGLYTEALEKIVYWLEKAAEVGITLSVEGHIGSFCETPEALNKLVRDVKGLTLTLDYTHFTKIGFKDEEIEILMPYATHFHARGACMDRAQTSFANNTIDYARVAEEMIRNNYSGYIGIEYVWIDWEHMNEVDNLSESSRKTR